MAARSGRTIPALTLGAATALLAALTPAPASAADDPLRPYTTQQPRWERCDTEQPATLECATIAAPLDYADPAGRRIDLTISRIRTDDTRRRHGVLLMNPGGPGSPGLSMPADMAQILPAQVRERYDLVGFDPRGVGRSSPLTCGLTEDERTVLHPYHDATFPKDVQRARTVADKCRAKAADVLPHLTTRNTARDMDLIRAVLGERKISYFGFSYGTYLGSVYTQLFPRRSDRIVLDSAVDPALAWRGTLLAWPARAELAFTRWSEWAAERDATHHLGATPAAVRRTFWDLIAHADRTPVPTTGAALDGDAIRAEYRAFVHPAAATDRITALKAAAAGGPPAPAAPDELPGDNEMSAAWAVFCGDTRTWPRDPEQYRRDARRERARHPLAGDLAAGIQPCAFWPTEAREDATTVDNTAGALIVQNEWDPQATLDLAHGMHRALHGSRMITVTGGEGHGVIVAGPSCADTPALHYLTTGNLPATDLTCPAA
ncbi:alpha/beta hydrolase [Kitasatospora sp. NPDC051170]|uniref:alpha/beta hydrolase n=1 Tax=Kitasatospora sp. NPDC051170 TaxID=3364056 RepID=UPI0037BBE05B